MTSTPETDVRAALTEAASMSGLGFDEAAVLSRGHRLVRRRRVATAGAGVAAVALAAVVAVQVSGNGFNRALPPAANPSETVVAVAGPIDETGEVLPGFDEGQKPKGFGARLSVKGGAGGQVVETWTVTDAGKAVKTFTRAAKVLDVGQASLVLPAESGIPDLVLGYVNTGSDRSVYAGVNTAPGQPMRSDGGETQLTDSSGPTQRHNFLFVQRFTGFDPSKIVGLSWGETNTNVARTGQRAILLNTGRSDLAAAVLTEPGGDQWISWASATQVGIAGVGGTSRPAAATGPLQLLGRPAVDNPTLGLHDKIFGWVTGNESTTVTVRTTASDSMVTAYGPARSGRRSFLITSMQGLVRGPVTVTGAGVTQTVDLNALRNATP